MNERIFDLGYEVAESIYKVGDIVHLPFRGAIERGVIKTVYSEFTPDCAPYYLYSVSIRNETILFSINELDLLHYAKGAESNDNKRCD